MSYKKIVAGVATFAVASAMVVPAAFAVEAATTQPAPDSAVKPAEAQPEYKILFDGKEYKLTAEGLKDLGLDVKYVQDWLNEKDAAVKSAESTLKTLDRFEKRATEIKVDDMIYTVGQLKGVLQAKLAELKKADIKTTNLNALKQLTKFMKEIENGVNKKMKTDPSALKKSGGEADKKASAKAAAKGGKNLPKTADAAPVAPVAAVAGSAALIAAGLVASRKVNA